MKPLLSRLDRMPVILSSGENDFGSESVRCSRSKQAYSADSGNFRHVDDITEHSNSIQRPSVPDTNHNDWNDGAINRAVVDHTYRDHYRDPVPFISYFALRQKDDTPEDVSSEGNENAYAGSKRKCMGQPITSPPRLARGGVTVAFPERLYDMLRHVADEGSNDIISWQPHGRCFLIHKKDAFVEKIMPSFFHQTKLTSFQRQLNLYGFIRLTSGKDRGAYYHEMFLRGRIDLCRTMIRTRIKGNGMKAASSPSTEPNFYTMEYCYDVNKLNQSSDSSKKDVEVINRRKASMGLEKVPSDPENSSEVVPDNVCSVYKATRFENDVYHRNSNPPCAAVVSPRSSLNLVEAFKAQCTGSMYQPFHNEMYFIKQSQYNNQSSQRGGQEDVPIFSRQPFSMSVPGNVPSKVEHLEWEISDCECSSIGNGFDDDESLTGFLESGDELFFEGLKFRYLDDEMIDQPVLKSFISNDSAEFIRTFDSQYMAKMGAPLHER